MTDPTTQDILDLLPIVSDRGWRVAPSGVIHDGAGLCPLAALAGEISGRPCLPGQEIGVLRSAGLWPCKHRMTADFWNLRLAADNPGVSFRPALMAALGMEAGNG